MQKPGICQYLSVNLSILFFCHHMFLCICHIHPVFYLYRYTCNDKNSIITKKNQVVR